MSIVFDEATKEDINELIRMRIAYMMDDFGAVSDHERAGMEAQLPDYFERKLGTELIAFVARDADRIVSVAYLHIIEMPANTKLLNGLYGEVLSVYTEPAYRGSIFPLPTTDILSMRRLALRTKNTDIAI